MAVDIWHWTPFCFLLLYAAVKSLPSDVFEAARIDGASAWQRCRLRDAAVASPAIMVVLAFRAIIAFKVFDEVYLLTSGGPGTATEVISLTIYRRFFIEDNAGYGAAMSVVAFLRLALIGSSCCLRKSDQAHDAQGLYWPACTRVPDGGGALLPRSVRLDRACRVQDADRACSPAGSGSTPSCAISTTCCSPVHRTICISVPIA